MSSSLTNIPTPPVLSSFPHHHSLSLLPLTPIKRAASPLYLTSCKQHTSTFSTFRFLNSSHTSVPLPEILPTFQLPNLTPRRFATFSLKSFNPEILSTPAHLRAAGDWGPKFSFASLRGFLGAFYFTAACPC